MPLRVMTVISGFSVVVGAAALILLMRTHDARARGEDRFSWLDGDGRRHTVRSEAGKLIWFAAPRADLAALPAHSLRTIKDLDAVERAAGTGAWQATWDAARPPARHGEPSLGQIVAKLDNSHRRVSAVYVTTPAGRIQVEMLWIHPRDGSGAEWLKPYTIDIPFDTTGYSTGVDPAPFAMTNIQAALLPLLEDPNRFAIAHALLCESIHDVDLEFGFESHADGSAAIRNYGMSVSSSPPATKELLPKKRADVPGLGVAKGYSNPDAPFRLNRAELPALREFWHRRLDVTVASVQWKSVMAVSLVLPCLSVSAFTARRIRHRTRRQAGRCPHCGYDLRASSGRCPECGAVSENHAGDMA